jgi:sporulation protein YlmC with PRC-barrel domain
MAIDRKRETGTLNDRTVTEPGSKEEERARNVRRVLSASTLAGDRVRNSAGEDLGKIEELMIDVPTGRIAYAVLSFGGFLGMGNKLFAIPWEALTVDEIEHQLILNVDKKTLEAAPGFDKDEWPDMADPTFGSQIYGYYGYREYWKPEDASTARETVADRERGKTLTGGGGI